MAPVGEVGEEAGVPLWEEGEEVAPVWEGEKEEEEGVVVVGQPTSEAEAGERLRKVAGAELSVRAVPPLAW